MIDNPMVTYHQPRLPYDQYMSVQAEYKQRRPEPKKEQGCIKPVDKTVGSRFHAQG